MIKVSALKKAEQRRLSLIVSRAIFNVFLTISLAALLITFICTTDSIISNLSIHSIPIPLNPFHPPCSSNQTFKVLQTNSTTYPITKSVYIVEQVTHQQNGLLNEKLPQFDIFKSTNLTRRFEKRARVFFKNRCKVRIFMTWISFSWRVFGDRELLALDALFKSNPNSCLMILSNSMDSVYGFRSLKRFTDRGFHIQAITPDLDFLFKNTPAQSWLDDIKNGKVQPGRIPLEQNLSNLIRLAILYKYGGVYVDTDFVILKDLSSLRNSIGAQSETQSGKWTRLNNAALIFDKNHSLLYKFMEEFATTFDGNIWGYNGPYLVSRVVERESITHKLNFTVLPRKVFYPVDWEGIGGLFISPLNPVHQRVEGMVGQLRRSTYGLHLWNTKSSRLRIEEGSIVDRLLGENCVICDLKNTHVFVS